MIGGVLDPFESRLDKLAATYDRDLFHGKTLTDLNAGPRIYFNSTNLATGNMFFFVAGGGKARGDGRARARCRRRARIFRSAARSPRRPRFRRCFRRCAWTRTTYPPASAVEYVTLTDGGVYDNMGINPAACAPATRSTTSSSATAASRSRWTSEPTESGAIVLKAALDIMMEQIRGLEFDRLQHRHLAQAGPRPLWFSIDSIAGRSATRRRGVRVGDQHQSRAPQAGRNGRC